jgi:lantibiotic modifying enzyme
MDWQQYGRRKPKKETFNWKQYRTDKMKIALQKIMATPPKKYPNTQSNVVNTASHVNNLHTKMTHYSAQTDEAERGFCLTLGSSVED